MRRPTSASVSWYSISGARRPRVDVCAHQAGLSTARRSCQNPEPVAEQQRHRSPGARPMRASSVLFNWSWLRSVHPLGSWPGGRRRPRRSASPWLRAARSTSSPRCIRRAAPRSGRRRPGRWSNSPFDRQAAPRVVGVALNAAAPAQHHGAISQVEEPGGRACSTSTTAIPLRPRSSTSGRCTISAPADEIPSPATPRVRSEAGPAAGIALAARRKETSSVAVLRPVREERQRPLRVISQAQVVDRRQPVERRRSSVIRPIPAGHRRPGSQSWPDRREADLATGQAGRQPGPAGWWTARWPRAQPGSPTPRVRVGVVDGGPPPCSRPVSRASGRPRRPGRHASAPVIAPPRQAPRRPGKNVTTASDPAPRPGGPCPITRPKSPPPWSQTAATTRVDVVLRQSSTPGPPLVCRHPDEPAQLARLRGVGPAAGLVSSSRGRSPRPGPWPRAAAPVEQVAHGRVQLVGQDQRVGGPGGLGAQRRPPGAPGSEP